MARLGPVLHGRRYNPRALSNELVAVSVQGDTDRVFHAFRDCCRAAQISFALLRHAGLQMAGTRMTMLCLALSRQAESLLSAFVRLLFGHGSASFAILR